MLRKIFETVPVPYALPDDPAIQPELFGYLRYNDYLTTPPRIYGEELFMLFATLASNRKTPASDIVIELIAFMAKIYYPSWQVSTFIFDAVTGAFIERIKGVQSFTLNAVTPGRDGVLFAGFPTGGITEMDAQTHLLIAGTDEPATKYSVTAIVSPMVDKVQNRILLADINGTEVRVHVWSTGALLWTVPLGEQVVGIFPEDQTRAYARTSSGLLVLIDYVALRVLGAVKGPAVAGTNVKISWDRFYRRFLGVGMTANATDGASTTTVKGYYPLPIGTYLTKPVPLRPLRKGRTVPCYVRLCGDIGEGIGGSFIEATATGAGALMGAPPSTTDNGGALLQLQCNAAGAVTVDCEAEVIDT